MYSLSASPAKRVLVRGEGVIPLEGQGVCPFLEVSSPKTLVAELSIQNISP
jgi:hypothetical protein